MRSHQPRESDGPKGTAFDAAVRLLGSREHSRFELGQKLSKRGFEPSEIDDAMDRLEEMGYLDDERFALLVIRQHDDLGRRGLQRKMTDKGISLEISGPLLDSIDSDEEYARALGALNRRVNQIPAAGPERDRWRKRLGGYLARRGFSMAVTLKAIDEVIQGSVDESFVDESFSG